MAPTDCARTRPLRQDLLRQALPWLVLLVGGGLVLAAAPRPTTQARGAVTVVYVGAEDCGPCRAWRRDRRAAFLDSGEFARLRYREIIAPRLRDLLTQADWPADLADLREQVRALAGAPQWFVLRDGKTLASGAGLSAWQHRIWPAIRVQVRHDPPRGGAAVSALFALPQACRGGSVRECVRDTTKEPDDPS